jgi:glycolate oxidase iron-sulfur subunit
MNMPLLGFSEKDKPNTDIINTCIHCGLCLPACPTYRETGVEMSSPRGRIYLIKAVNEGRVGLDSEVFLEQMSQCLNCRACEAVCPSGVRYGAILEASRAQIEQARKAAVLDHQSKIPWTAQGWQNRKSKIRPRPWPQRFLRRAIFGGLFKHMDLFRTFSTVMRLYQRSGAQRLARKSGLLKWLKLQEMESILPPVNHRFTIPQGQRFPAEGQRNYTVALLSGCIMSTAFANVHDATIRVLQKNGCDVLLPPNQGCCGALHIHSGDLDGGRDLARRNIAAFEGLDLDAIIVNAAGCGSTLKEYDHLLYDDPAWRSRAEAVSAKVKDIYEFLAAIELNRSALGPLPISVTYQEPCHLAHAQRIMVQPRLLLKAIPQLELREMPESALCCGSAGIYNLTQPQMAQQLAARKINNALTTGAQVIATANPGCALQLAAELRCRGVDVQMRYIVELLDESYRRG